MLTGTIPPVRPGAGLPFATGGGTRSAAARSASRLGGKRILLVEDEFFLADDLCRDLQAMGAIVVGPAPSVAQAMALIEAGPAIDAAVLDFKLGSETVQAVADELLRRSVPFVFASAYDDRVLVRHYPGVSRCFKPIELPVVVDALAAVLVS